MKLFFALLLMVGLSFGATANLTVTFTADTNAVTDIQTYLTKQVQATSTLQLAMLSTDTTLTLTAIPTGVATTGTILIGTELIAYTGITGNQLTGLTRGTTLTNAANNTTAAAHILGSTVQFLQFNAVRAWVVSVVLNAAQQAIQSLGVSSALIGTQVTTINTNTTTENTNLTGAIQ